MRAMGAPRTWSLIAALMLSMGVAACAADEDASVPGELPSVDLTAPSEGAEESPDGSGLPAAEPEEETPEADQE